ncbi:DEAD/DEAH box helicase [Pseudoalteromonas sp. T1lg65]|uniref:DEAD/DEAH box helicase n=1 Tax=Pseudoalteromonas sp. T1lg65 TaxID=2077101 RepID=UPI003F798BF5
MAFTLSTHTPQHIDLLINRYQALPMEEQQVLSTLAVIYKPISPIKLKKIVALLADKDVFPPSSFCSSIPHSKILAWQKLELVNFSEEGLQVSPFLAKTLCIYMQKDNCLLAILSAGEEVTPVLNAYEWERQFVDEQRLARDFLLLGQFKKAIAQLKFAKNPQAVDHKFNHVLLSLYFYPFDLEEFLQLPDALQFQCFASLFYHLLQSSQNITAAVSLLDQVCQQNTSNSALKSLQHEFALYSDTTSLSTELTPTALHNNSYNLQIQAVNELFQNDFQACETHFSQALLAKNSFGKRKQPYLGRTLGIFHKLYLLHAANNKDAKLFDELSRQIDAEVQDSKEPYSHYYANNVILYLSESLANSHEYNGSHLNYLSQKTHQPFDFYLGALLDAYASFWCNQHLTAKQQTSIADCFDYFTSVGLKRFAAFAQQLQAALSDSTEKKHDDFELPSLIERKSKWDVALDKLIALAPSPQEKANQQGKRLIWQLRFGRFDLEFLAREQKQGKSGWGKGKPIANKVLAQNPEKFTYLTPQDKKLVAQISVAPSYTGRTEYRLAGLDAMRTALGADNLYFEDDLNTPITLVEKMPELVVSENQDQLLVTIPNLPSEFIEANCYSLSRKPDCIEFTVFDQSHMKVAEIIGESGLIIPKTAKDKLLKGIRAVAPYLNVQSTLSDIEIGLETTSADDSLIINIQPYQRGLDFHCVVMPFGEKGPLFQPGHGAATVTAEIDGKRLATTRALLIEQERLEQLDQHCPPFLEMTDNRLTLDEPESALEVLAALEQLMATKPSPMPVQLRWPKGKKITLSKKLESQHLQLAMSKKNQWFDLTGELQIDDQQVIDFKALLKMVATSNGRFITLENEQVLVLSEQLKSQLDTLNQVAHDGQFHPLASPIVQQAMSGMRMKTLPAWEAQTQQMQQVENLVVNVPNTLNATLRDYQLAGFDWAMRLAHWGAGACLADDMGLGKTLQALAVILARAPKGPTLVIAPTSVCFNWQREIRKFAPTLNVHTLSDYDNGEQRTNMLAKLTALDCVIVSYGLLQREIEQLKRVSFTTIVADEAQALKNPLAKRSQAACALKGEFKMVTTGTPIENNLTELWSIFRFVNPGLLGNLKRFSEKFSLPIENAEQDRLAAHRAKQGLKQLLQPFILRRMKHQVLSELPAKTEINQFVTLSEEERVFYEALRQNAIDEISDSSQHDNAQTQRFKLFAALTKLRQAACNPQLVMAESQITSAKLHALDKLLDELLDNGHRALIFSQFVSHLQLIKQHLEKRGIRYQYLDGSTPAKQRESIVTAFQQGHGEVFLISLKAGGSGLNLTAADYVIHMDPWWNPAVEEQASDRAHRLGQKRPVTIYRLIAQNTIEERIVELHTHKRDIAEQLLANTDKVEKLNVQDVLAMLKQTL